jgi:hypothetical protein
MKTDQGLATAFQFHVNHSCFVLKFNLKIFHRNYKTIVRKVIDRKFPTC